MLTMYDLTNGHKLFIGNIKNHGVAKAPFGCRKLILSGEQESLRIERSLPGIFSPDDCMDWILDDTETIKELGL